MAERDHELTDQDLAFDQELAELFGAFDEVEASEDLKSRTLAAVLAAIDEDEDKNEAQEQQEPAAQEQVESGFAQDKTEQAPRLTLVADAGQTSRPKQDMSTASSTSKAPKKRQAAWKMRLAAGIAAIAILGSGVAAFTVPVSHVQVSEGDASVTLGVNVFGTTVSAEADDEKGEEVLKDLDVRNKSVDDAKKSVEDALQKKIDEEEARKADSQNAPKEEDKTEPGAGPDQNVTPIGNDEPAANPKSENKNSTEPTTVGNEPTAIAPDNQQNGSGASGIVEVGDRGANDGGDAGVVEIGNEGADAGARSAGNGGSVANVGILNEGGNNAGANNGGSNDGGVPSVGDAGATDNGGMNPAGGSNSQDGSGQDGSGPAGDGPTGERSPGGGRGR